MTKKHPYEKFDDFRSQWIPYLLDQCPGFIRNRLTEDQLQESLEHDLYEDYDRLTSADWAVEFHRYINLPKSKLEDFQYRYLETPLGAAITSIRYIGGDKAKPAVFILHKDFELVEPDHIHIIGQQINEDYALFKPQRFRWFSQFDASNLIESTPGLNGDLVYVAQYLDALRAIPSKSKPESLHFKQAYDLSWYDKYHKDFKTMLESNPSFREVAGIESKDSMQLLLNSKSLFLAYENDEWIGVVGALPQTHRYFHGHEVYEEYLLESYRGRGWAKHLQRHLIERLDAPQQEMLYGTIHYKNVPSYRTALSCGRKFCGMYVMADIT